MKLTHTIILTTGEPIVIVPPSMDDHHIIRAYHEALLKEVHQIRYFHTPSADPQLYEAFKPLYQAVCSRLSPAIDADILPSEERHRLLICGDVIPHPDNPDAEVLALSALEELMGYKLASSGKPKRKDDDGLVTSGVEHIDALGELILIAGPEIALQLSQRYGLTYLMELCRQVNDRRRGKEAINERKSARLNAKLDAIADEFDANPMAWLGSLAENGVVIPEWVVKGNQN